jgi:maltose alpha-D-glucosyltransferase/alpha-amylase
LEAYLQPHRWFAGKSRVLQDVDILDAFTLSDRAESQAVRLLLLSASYAQGEPENYLVPVSLLNADEAEHLLNEHPQAGILRLRSDDAHESEVLCESTWNDEMWSALLAVIADRRRLSGSDGTLVGVQTIAFGELWSPDALTAKPAVHSGEQSNTSARIDGRFILKLYRRVSTGVNPDFEIGKQLTEHHVETPIPRVAGAIEYRTTAGQIMTVAILHEFIENVSDAWTYTLEELGRFTERVQMRSTADANEYHEVGQEASAANRLPEDLSFWELMGQPRTELIEATVGPYMSAAELLGGRTAEMHLALATAQDDAAFAPEPFTRLYQRSLYQSMRSQARATLQMLTARRSQLQGESVALLDAVLSRESDILACFAGLLTGRLEASRIRCHGDYHLGQVLFTGKDFVIVDFEGEPDRPASERRIKASPLRDVAGMLRSFHYAAHAAMRGRAPSLISEHVHLPRENWAEFWTAWTSAAFLQSYLESADAGSFNPPDRMQVRTLLTCYLMEKALYELRYELNNRPDWAGIPLEGIRHLLPHEPATV